jgi:outer membrane protein assembly factor BamD
MSSVSHRALSALRRIVSGAALVSALALGGCGSLSLFGESGPPQEPTVEALYNRGMDRVSGENWREAAAAFEEVERLYPYSVWARRALLMSAFSYYQLNKYQEAIGAAERFIALHAGNKDAPYAFYLRAVSMYEQIVDVGRDQETTAQARAALNEVVQRYPGTAYAKDAGLKMDLTQDHLAGKEMAIGRYYLRRDQYVAAINRFRTVVEEYQTTSQVPEALYRLTEAYLALGLTGEAQKAAAILGYNYPANEWYGRAYGLMTGTQVANSERGWLDRTFGSIF